MTIEEKIEFAAKTLASYMEMNAKLMAENERLINGLKAINSEVYDMHKVQNIAMRTLYPECYDEAAKKSLLDSIAQTDSKNRGPEMITKFCKEHPWT